MAVNCDALCVRGKEKNRSFALPPFSLSPPTCASVRTINRTQPYYNCKQYNSIIVFTSNFQHLITTVTPIYPPGLLRAAEDRRDRLTKPAELGIVMWSVARSQTNGSLSPESSRAFLTNLWPTVASRISTLDPQAIFNVTWAYVATGADASTKDALPALCRAAERCARRFTFREAAGMLLALSKARCFDDGAFQGECLCGVCGGAGVGGLGWGVGGCEWCVWNSVLGGSVMGMRPGDGYSTVVHMCMDRPVHTTGLTVHSLLSRSPVGIGPLHPHARQAGIPAHEAATEGR